MGQHGKFRIVEAAYQLGLGGTERVLENYCRNLDKSRFDVIVVGFEQGGERADILCREGYEVVIANGDEQIWEQVLRGADVLHWHHDGHLPPKVFQSVGKSKPRLVIQTNVFGLGDRSDFYDLVDLDLYVSKMCLVRRVREDGGRAASHSGKRAVLYNAVDLEMLRRSMPSSSEIVQLRSELGVGNAPTVGRIGRADDGKFHSVAIRMMPILKKWVPGVKFLLLGGTSQMRRLTERLGVQDSFVWVEPTPEVKKLMSYYCCIDVYLAVSDVGETFGMNIAEAMVCGLPVVAVSTPNVDNAQVELVDNGKTGLVVEAYPRLVAMACEKLLMDSDKRLEMGRAGAEKVKEYSAAQIVRRFENAVCETLEGRNPVSNGCSFLIPWSADVESEYDFRLKNLFAKPNIADRAREWIRVKGGRLRLKLSHIVRRLIERRRIN